MEDITREIREEFLNKVQDLLKQYQAALNRIEKTITSKNFDTIISIIHRLKQNSNSRVCCHHDLLFRIQECETSLKNYHLSKKVKVKEFKDVQFRFLTELITSFDSLKDVIRSDSNDINSKFDKMINEGFIEKLKILIVDDDEVMLDLTKSIIKDQYTNSAVITISDSYEAVKILEKTQFDIIISDFNMPGLNGTDLLKATKNIEINKMTPFIIITGFKPAINESSDLFENVFFLEKPFEEKNIFYYIHCSIQYDNIV